MPAEDGVGGLRFGAVGSVETGSAATEAAAGGWAATVGLSGRRTVDAAGGSGTSALSLDDGGRIRAARVARAGGEATLLGTDGVLSA
jgi:hypothetical protein